MLDQFFSGHFIWVVVISLQITFLLTQANILGIIRHSRNGFPLRYLATIPTWTYVFLFLIFTQSSTFRSAILIALPAFWLYAREDYRERTAQISQRLETAVSQTEVAVRKAKDAISQATLYESQALKICAVQYQTQREMQTTKVNSFYDSTSQAWSVFDGIATTASELAAASAKVEENAYNAQEEAQKAIKNQKTGAETTSTPQVETTISPQTGATGASRGGTAQPAASIRVDDESEPSTETGLFLAHGFYEQAVLAGEASRDAERQATELRLKVTNFKAAEQQSQKASEEASTYAANSIKALQQVILDHIAIRQTAEQVFAGAHLIEGKCSVDSRVLCNEGRLDLATSSVEVAEKTVIEVEDAAKKAGELSIALREKLVGLIQIGL